MCTCSTSSAQTDSVFIINRLVTVALAATLLGASSYGANLLLSAREAPKKKARTQRGVAVETLVVKEQKHQLDVRASGTVVPARDLDVFPQVSGRIQWLYKNLVPGTFVEKGQTLFRIDPSSYRLALDQQQAELTQAQSALKLEQGKQLIARSELEILTRGPRPEHETHAGTDLETHALALRKPQLEAATGDLASAEARLKGAQLELSRTSFAAPFPAVVVEASAEIGQLASPQTRLARLVGTEQFWVRVPLPKDQLAHISIAGIQGEKGSKASVRQEVGEHTVERHGHVVRLLSNLEPGSRMARVLVEIEDPYGLEAATDEAALPFPMLLDAYVDVHIAGKQARRLIEVPRSALTEGDRVHVFERDTETLSIRKVNVVWQRVNSVLVDQGLKHGERVIVSPIAAAVNGIKLRDVSKPDTGTP